MSSFETSSDVAAREPAYVPAKSGLYLNDRQLSALFERVCDDAGVSNWTGWDEHFAVTPEDIRTELRRVLYSATVELDLRHALRIVAWTWERENVLS